MPGPGAITCGSFSPSGHSPAFWAMMHAHGLEEGDPVERFIEVFGEPHSVADAPMYGDGVKSYTWKNDSYYWPQRKGFLLLPRFPVTWESPNKANASDETVVPSSTSPDGRSASLPSPSDGSQSRR